MIRKDEYFRTTNRKVKPSFAGWSNSKCPKFITSVNFTFYRHFVKIWEHEKMYIFTCHETDFLNLPGFVRTFLCVWLVQVSSDLLYREGHVPVKSKSHTL
jgi:hypothetical protein